MVNMEAREDLKTVAHEVFRIIDDHVKLDPCIEEVIPKGPDLWSHYRIHGTIVCPPSLVENQYHMKLPLRLTKVNGKYVAFVFEIAHEEIRFYDGMGEVEPGEFMIFHYGDPKLFEKIKAKVEEYA